MDLTKRLAAYVPTVLVEGGDPSLPDLVKLARCEGTGDDAQALFHHVASALITQCAQDKVHFTPTTLLALFTELLSLAQTFMGATAPAPVKGKSKAPPAPVSVEPILTLLTLARDALGESAASIHPKKLVSFLRIPFASRPVRTATGASDLPPTRPLSVATHDAFLCLGESLPHIQRRQLALTVCQVVVKGGVRIADLDTLGAFHRCIAPLLCEPDDSNIVAQTVHLASATDIACALRMMDAFSSLLTTLTESGGAAATGGRDGCSLVGAVAGFGVSCLSLCSSAAEVDGIVDRTMVLVDMIAPLHPSGALVQALSLSLALSGREVLALKASQTDAEACTPVEDALPLCHTSFQKGLGVVAEIASSGGRLHAAGACLVHLAKVRSLCTQTGVKVSLLTPLSAVLDYVETSMSGADCATLLARALPLLASDPMLPE
ncbi:hypothetical protein KIPB_011664, partial [Kipferlia bialata]|eukprot:g11664.t1